MEKMKYVCEVCGKTEIMTPEEAYQEGWDYPPLVHKKYQERIKAL